MESAKDWQDTDSVKYTLTLFVAGASPNSAKAVVNIRAICDEYLKDRHELEVIDIHQHPEIAAREQVIAVPLLIKRAPYPFKRLIGDMSDRAKVLSVLEIFNQEYQ